MALREAELHVRFAGGIDTESDPKAIPAVQLAALQNGVFDRKSAIRKCNGYEALGNAVDGSLSEVSGAIRMAARGDELLEFTPNRCYSRETGASQWSDAGPVYSVPGTDRPLVRTGTQQTAPDHATLSGVTVSAWEDSQGGVWWSATDATSHRVLKAATQADALGRSPRCVPCGTVLHVYYAVPSTHCVMVLVVNPTSPSASVTPAILIDDLDATNSVYDACPTGRTNTPAAIVWCEHATTNLRLGYVDTSGVLGGPLTGHPSVVTYSSAARAAATPLGISFLDVDGADGDRIAVAAWTGATDGRTIFFSGGNGATTAIALLNSFAPYAVTNALRTTVAILANGSLIQAYAAWEESAAAASNRFTVSTVSELTGATSSTVGTVRSVGLAAKAFVQGTDAFATFVHDTTYFNTYVTLRISASDFVQVGRHAPANAGGAPARSHLPSAHVDDTAIAFALPFRERLFSENNDKFRETGIRLYLLAFDSSASHQAAQIGAGLYMVGACPQHYDGRIWTEQGFHFGPELITTANAGGGSMTPSTTYEYRCWYESTDSQGEVHLGPTSAGTLVTMAGGETQVTLTLPTLRVTRKSNVRIGVARSLAAKTGDTARFFRVTSLDPSTAGSANGYVASTVSADTVSFLDRMSDAELALQEELYTDGGTLSNDPTALGSLVAVGKTRLVFSDPSDGNLLHVSQPLDPGYGAEIPPDIMVACDPFGGDITALTVQDDRYVVFKRGAIFMFSGDGPTPSGDTSTSGFSAPQLVTSDVGCTEPASIVLTPVGHMFKTAKGIYLLARDGSVSYVGSPVHAYNSQTVRRATVMPDRTQVMFLTDSGTSLIYDYRKGQWSQRTNHEGHDAAVVSNTYHYLRTDGRVFRETVGSYSDAGQRIKLRFETAPLHLQEHLQGFQKFYEMFLLGTWVSPHQLGIQYRTDYAQQWNDLLYVDATGLTDGTGWLSGDGVNVVGNEPITGTAYGDGDYGDDDYGGTPDGLYEWRLDIYEKGSSIQFAFEDFEADGYLGASFELTELVLTGGVKRLAPKPFTAERSI